MFRGVELEPHQDLNFLLGFGFLEDPPSFQVNMGKSCISYSFAKCTWSQGPYPLPNWLTCRTIYRSCPVPALISGCPLQLPSTFQGNRRQPGEVGVYLRALSEQGLNWPAVFGVCFHYVPLGYSSTLKTYLVLWHHPAVWSVSWGWYFARSNILWPVNYLLGGKSGSVEFSL